tara:strand:- start:2076 stop:2333 length:258 start_codon:yes stop_codon:yes gene_type:complete
MASTINLSLTDELKNFVQKNSGDGSLHSTPSDYVRDLIRHEMDRKESADARQKILRGYQDAIDGKLIPYNGDLKTELRAFRSKEK